MSITIGSPANLSKEQKVEWCIQALYTIVRYLNDTEIGVITDAFTLEDSAAITELRTLPTAATTTDVRDVLATLIKDFGKRGSKQV